MILPGRLATFIIFGGDDECWPFTGRLHRTGHGQFNFEKKVHYAHRLVYKAAHPDENIDGKIVRHSCDNGACCNPRHLLCGTHGDNVKDRVDRNRSAVGSRNGRAKLSEDQAREIYQSEIIQARLAEQYGVNRRVIFDIKSGNTWRTATTSLRNSTGQSPAS